MMMRSSLSRTTASLRTTSGTAAKTAVKRRLQWAQSRSKSSVGPRMQPLHIETKRVARSSSEKMAIVDSKNHRRRQQHQLVVSSNSSSSSASAVFHNYPYANDLAAEEEEQRRIEAMKVFLDSLQLATAQTTLSKTATTSIPSALGSESERLKRSHGISPASKPATPLVESVALVEDELSTANEAMETKTIEDPVSTSPPPKTKGEPNDFERLKSALRHSIYRKDLKNSMYLFRESQRKRQILPRVAVTDLFFMVSEFDPASAYNIIQYYNTHYLHQDAVQDNGGRALDGATKKRLSLYKRIANCISLLDPNHHNSSQMHEMIESLLNEIDEMDVDTKRILYPKLVISLVSQRIATIGQYARKLYDFMIEHDFELKAGWLNRLLSLSRYNRQNDVPFYDVVDRLVQIPGGQLNPDAILPAIQNLFPYTKTEPICVTLEAWLRDFRNKHGFDEEITELNPEHLVDLSMLETISTGAAQAGSSRLIMLVWEVLEVCRYSPTETIYENTVIAFANEKGGLQQAFAALASMKEDGFEPSRPLIRSFSSAMRLHRFLIGKARRMLIEDRQNEISSIESNQLLSLESLNVILSAYAERADPTDAVEILDVMNQYDIQPNADSYSFVIEALGRDIKKRLKLDDQSYKQRNVEIADTILSMMEGNGISPTTHVIRNYVELLCLAGEIDTATSIVEDYLTSDDPEIRRIVNNITTYRVATENAVTGNFETAKKLASMMTEYVPALHRAIKSREQRSQYVEEYVNHPANETAS